MFCWPLVLVWGLFWGGAYLVLREVNPANAVALLILPVLLAAAPGNLLSRYTSGGVPAGEFTLFAAASILVVLVKHLGPVRAYIDERREARSRRRDTGAGGES